MTSWSVAIVNSEMHISRKALKVAMIPVFPEWNLNSAVAEKLFLSSIGYPKGFRRRYTRGAAAHTTFRRSHRQQFYWKRILIAPKRWSINSFTVCRKLACELPKVRMLNLNNMRILFYRLLVVAGSVLVIALSACASSNGSKQSRIERKISNPETENVQIGTAHYNQYSKSFEEPWPFGPYSN
jgi:hypothetical protein